MPYFLKTSTVTSSRYAVARAKALSRTANFTIFRRVVFTLRCRDFGFDPQIARPKPQANAMALAFLTDSFKTQAASRHYSIRRRVFMIRHKFATFAGGTR